MIGEVECVGQNVVDMTAVESLHQRRQRVEWAAGDHQPSPLVKSSCSARSPKQCGDCLGVICLPGQPVSVSTFELARSSTRCADRGGAGRSFRSVHRQREGRPDWPEQTPQELRCRRHHRSRARFRGAALAERRGSRPMPTSPAPSLDLQILALEQIRGRELDAGDQNVVGEQLGAGSSHALPIGAIMVVW